MTTAKIYSFANQKGGVAKTTSAVNLGAYIASTGRKVLIVDIDPQSNATTSLGINPRSIPLSVYDVLLEPETVHETLTLTEWVGLDLLPATPELAGAEIEIVGVDARERLLSRALKAVAHQYDYIFIDGPPSLGLLTVNSLTAANQGVIVPVQCEYLALEGVSLLMKTIEQVREVLNNRLKIAGVLLTMYDGRTNLGRQVVQEVREHFSAEVFQTIIPRNVRLSEAPSHGQTIRNYAPSSVGAHAYAAFAKEFLLRVEGVQVEIL